MEFAMKGGGVVSRAIKVFSIFFAAVWECQFWTNYNRP